MRSLCWGKKIVGFWWQAKNRLSHILCQYHRPSALSHGDVEAWLQSSPTFPLKSRMWLLEAFIILVLNFLVYILGVDGSSRTDYFETIHLFFFWLLHHRMVPCSIANLRAAHFLTEIAFSVKVSRHGNLPLRQCYLNPKHQKVSAKIAWVRKISLTLSNRSAHENLL